MPTSVVQHLGDRRQAVGRARGVRDDLVLGRQLVVIDAVDDGEVGVVGRCRDQHPLGAGRRDAPRPCPSTVKMPVHSSAMSTPSSLCGSLAGSRSAVTLIWPRPTSIVSPSTFTSPGKRPCTLIEPQQVGIGLDGAEIVDRHDLDVLAARFGDGAQDVATDATEAVDCHPNRHHTLRFERLDRRSRHGRRSAEHHAGRNSRRQCTKTPSGHM